MTIARTVEPEQVGLNSRQLAAIDSHFARYVDDGRLVGWQIVVARGGQVAHASTYGHRDREAGEPVIADTLWRIFSMTKPITSVAALMLWEQGRLELTDEVSRWLPEFADLRVYQKGSAVRLYTVPATEPIRVWHLLTHTSGLTYGFLHTSVVDAVYRSAGYDLFWPDGLDLAGVCRDLARLPLLFQPGSAWGYSVAHDVLGRVIELVCGQSLPEFFAEHILGPLGMTDTHWWVDEAAAPRLAALYMPHPKTGRAELLEEYGAMARTPPAVSSGGLGLISSAADYHRFTQMLLREGELDGVRLLGSRTVRFMTRNHLPGGKDLGQLSTGGFAETILDGVGYGLGVAVIENPIPGRVPGTEGSYYWGGIASTAFWIDPAENLTAMLFTQLVPSSTYPLRPQLRQLLYSALI